MDGGERCGEVGGKRGKAERSVADDHDDEEEKDDEEDDAGVAAEFEEASC